MNHQELCYVLALLTIKFEIASETDFEEMITLFSNLKFRIKFYIYIYIIIINKIKTKKMQ